MKFTYTAEYMQEFRLSLGAKMTQRKLADLNGCHNQFVSNWERGLSAPPLSYVKKFAKKYKSFNKQKFCECYAEDYKQFYLSKVREEIG